MYFNQLNCLEFKVFSKTLSEAANSVHCLNVGVRVRFSVTSESDIFPVSTSSKQAPDCLPCMSHLHDKCFPVVDFTLIPVYLCFTGSFEQGMCDNTVLKKLCNIERAALHRLSDDPLQEFVPMFYGTTVKEGIGILLHVNHLGSLDSRRLCDI